jgi:DNA-3-methyladenine glycosylase
MFENPLSPSALSNAPLIAREFYQRPTRTVARELLGKLLMSESSAGIAAVRLTEVEAYLGVEDPACHTFGGRRTPRNESMWGEAGRAYVYLIYGVHHCFNVVTAEEGVGEAVLIRGGVPVAGLDLVIERRGAPVPRAALTDGPGKLCQALSITRADDGLDLYRRRSGLWLCDDGLKVSERDLSRTPRVGVRSAGGAAQWPLRFAVVNQSSR